MVTPGLIDAGTTLGLSGLATVSQDQDEKGGPNQASLRAIDAFRFEEPLVVAALQSGVTAVHAGPGTANPIAGRAGVFKTSAPHPADAVVAFPSALVLSLTEAAKTTYGSKGKYPSTRMATAGFLRQALVDARQYSQRRSDATPPARDLNLDALASMVKGEVTALIAADCSDEIATALRIAEEFEIRPVLLGGSEADLVVERLAGAK